MKDFDNVAANAAGHMFGQFKDQVMMPVAIGILLLAAALYSLPFIIAFFRGHKSKKRIFFLNILLGWTVICWIWAFVISVGGTKKPSGKRSPPRKKTSPRKKKRR